MEKGLIHTILRAPVTIPLSPLTAVATLARRVGAIAQEEMDQEAELKETFLELQMRREMEEITEEEFKKRTEEIDRKLEELKEPSK